MSDENSIVDLAKKSLEAYSSARVGLLELRSQIVVSLSELTASLEAVDSALGSSSGVTEAPEAPESAPDEKPTPPPAKKTRKVKAAEKVTPQPEIVVEEDEPSWEDENVAEEAGVDPIEEIVDETPAKVAEEKEEPIIEVDEVEAGKKKSSVPVDIDEIPF